MKIYMRFDENGNQTEVATLTTKPTASGWKAAPTNFDHSKRYRLNDAGKVEEIFAEELEATRFAIFKERALDQVAKLIDASGNKFLGTSATKRKSYELQEKAANAALADSSSALGFLIQPLAKVRNISVEEMARMILAKAELANQKIMQMEALEDECKNLIQNAETAEQVNQALSKIATILNGEAQ